MPFAILWSNLAGHKFSADFRRSLIKLLANCARKSPEGTGLVVHTDCKCSLGSGLDEPAIFLLFKASGPAINALDNADHADRICAFLRAELGIPAHRVIIQFEQLDRGSIGFCGTTKLDMDRAKEDRGELLALRKKSTGFFREANGHQGPF